MVLVFVLPFWLLLYFSMMEPVVLGLGFSVPGYIQAYMYSRVFDKIEGVDRSKKETEEKEHA